ncbi:hypothetical protein MMAG44476_38090 [Mycolicibacterium mageritense DSM 44476 = CIP 104973]|uniref:Uncharacterized protein n=1 Tax=Mycolicibacterium mageritense TaxID=53462 RepID=A0ABN5YLB9_MYCME|nr:hypothetical protein [Mycolicibacterium mageritense]BBX38022.1 hypothetical protein MMAGJ_73040 [Mycolicibacterium mageritense]
MAGTKVDEPLDVEFDDIDPDAKPEPDLKTDPNDEPKTEPKSEPKADPKPAGGGGDPKTATPAPDAPTPDTPADPPSRLLASGSATGSASRRKNWARSRPSRGRAQRAS